MYRMLHLFPVFLIAKAPLFLKPLKHTGHVDIRDQVQDLLGQTLSHQLICEPCGEIHQFRTAWEEIMTILHKKKNQRTNDKKKNELFRWCFVFCNEHCTLLQSI